MWRACFIVSNAALPVILSCNTYLQVMLSVFRHIHRKWRVGKVKLSNANQQIASTGVVFTLLYPCPETQNCFNSVTTLSMCACMFDSCICVCLMYAFICMCLWASDVHVIVYKDMCLYYGVINSSGSISQQTHSYLSSLSSCLLWTMCYTTLQCVSITFLMLRYLWTYLEIHTSM